MSHADVFVVRSLDFVPVVAAPHADAIIASSARPALTSSPNPCRLFPAASRAARRSLLSRCIKKTQR